MKAWDCDCTEEGGVLWLCSEHRKLVRGTSAYGVTGRRLPRFAEPPTITAIAFEIPEVTLGRA